MAYGSEGQDLGSIVAGADLSALQFTAVQVGSAGIVGSSAGAPTDGILQNAPASGEIARVRTDFLSKAVAGASFAKGVELMVGTSGKLILATSGNNIVARALEAASADLDIVAVLISKQGIKAA